MTRLRNYFLTGFIVCAPLAGHGTDPLILDADTLLLGRERMAMRSADFAETRPGPVDSAVR